MPHFSYTPRSYLHFDRPVNAATAEMLATSASAVEHHSFLPFIQYTIWTQKIKKGPDGGIIRQVPKARPIAYAAHQDAHIYTHYAEELSRRYEATLKELGLERSVTAFRPVDRKSNIHFANEVFDFISRCDQCEVFATDISDYFGTIKHDRLKVAWAKNIGVTRLPEDHFKVFRSLTKYALVQREMLCEQLGLDPEQPRADGRRRYCTPRQFRDLIRGGGLITVNRKGFGIPQGSPISAMLSNLYLLEFDTAISSLATLHGGLYRRYCDDILVVMPTAELRALIQQRASDLLTDLGLQIHPTKTEVTAFTRFNNRLVTSKPLNYLGFSFDGRFKRIRPASIARFYKKMRAGVGRAKALRSAASRNAGQWVPLRRRQLYLRYSYIGRRNFISYALRAAAIMKDNGIKKQVKFHWRELQALIGNAKAFAVTSHCENLGTATHPEPSSRE